MTQTGLWSGLVARIWAAKAESDHSQRAPAAAGSVAPSAGDSLISLLASEDAATARAAVSALGDPVLVGSPSREAIRLLAIAVDRCAEHRNSGIAELLVRFRASRGWGAVTESTLKEVLADSGHPIHLVIRGLVRRGKIGDDAALLWRAMAEPAWTAVCKERLSQRLTRDERAALAASGYLGLNPQRGRLADTRSISAAMELSIASGDIAGLAAIAGEEGARAAIAATRAIALQRSGDAAARTARAETLAKLATAAQDGQKSVADQASVHDAGVALRRGVRIGRDGVVRELRAELLCADPRRVLSAIRDARAGALARELTAELSQVAIGSEIRPAAAACTALRGACDDRAFEALRVAARSDDQRVAANAIEALSMVAIRMGRFAGVRQPLIDATADERHRVRAAAARALALVGDPLGEKTVMAMLADARAGHRMAGIWVVQRLLRAGVLAPGAELATAIDTLTSEDRVSTIRRRGAECQATLQRELDVKFQPASGD